MSRIRTVKPEFWKHEELSELPPETHMLAAALLNYSDDEGYFNANPRLVKAECCPLRDDAMNIPDALQELSNIGYIRLGKGSDGKQYGQVVKFSDHQVISHKKPSKIKGVVSFREPSSSLPVTVRPEQGTGNREQGKREAALTQTVAVAKGADPTPDLPPIPENLKRGTRLSLESLPDDWRSFCQAERPDLDPERTWAIFQDHWRGKAGKDGVKLDWLATWRNWVRREGKGNGINRRPDGSGGRETKDERAKAAIVRGLEYQWPDASE